jgi:hydrogenase small subunit
MQNNPTGAMGLSDHLGHKWKSKAGIPIVNIPGCPAQPDNITETLMYLCFALVGRAPVPELDDVGRPKWLFERTDARELQPRRLLRGGRLRQGVRRPQCLVKLGCKGPVVKCNVPLRGWVNGVGGCPNVGGICMACTMPGFPDKYMPFMDPTRWAASRRPRRASPTARSCAGAGT